MSHRYWNSDDIEPNGRYRLPWIYRQLSKEESGLYDRETKRPRPKAWYVPRATLNRHIAEGRLPVHGDEGHRYVRGKDLIRYLQRLSPLEPPQGRGRSPSVNSRPRPSPDH